MLGTVVYGIVFLAISFACWRIFKNLKVILLIGIALVFGYFLTNYYMKDKNLTDQNIRNKTSSFIDKVEILTDNLEKWNKEQIRKSYTDPYADTSTVYRKMIERSAEASREAYENMEKEAERRRIEDAKVTARLKAARDAGIRNIYGTN
jgi:predicted small secreted protein